MLYNMCARYVYCYDYVIEADNYEDAEMKALELAENDYIENYNFEELYVKGYEIEGE